ncbi:MAG: tagaturonate reductase [Cyclobacteriaceae bacterium]
MNLDRTNASLAAKRPIKILQFGEGNFLRAFANWMIDILNEKSPKFNAGVSVIQPIDRGLVHMLKAQDGLYHHLIRGIQKGKEINDTRLISCIDETINPFESPEDYFAHASNNELKIILSNTTEAGIRFEDEDLPESGLANTFPGKLTQLLKKRFDHFEGNAESGLVFIPCELIEKNGEKLKAAILQYAEKWSLGDSFIDWISNHNYFGNTLVDRIVPGYPKEEIKEIQERIGYDDQLVVASEVFHLWVIEGPKEIQKVLPADEYGLNVKFVDDLTPYRTQKVRILNGTHTAMVPVGLLAQIETVRETVEDEITGKFVKSVMYEEIAPTIDLPQDGVRAFADEIMERFKNPFIRHELKSISLNSISKFKVRVLPTIKDYIQANENAPKRLIFSLACLIKLYLSDSFQATDDQFILDLFNEWKAANLSNESLAEKILSQKSFWGEDLTSIASIQPLLISYLDKIEVEGIKEILKTF